MTACERLGHDWILSGLVGACRRPGCRARVGDWPTQREFEEAMGPPIDGPRRRAADGAEERGGREMTPMGSKGARAPGGALRTWADVVEDGRRRERAESRRRRLRYAALVAIGTALALFAIARLGAPAAVTWP
jgi:hypothetical protein